MNKQDLDYFKKKLLEEKARLESELSGISRRDTASPGGRDATAGGMEVDPADENELADKLEEMDDNNGIADTLEKQLAEVDAALERIKNGTYGLDEATGKPIDRARLEANPSARNSIKK